MVSTKGNLVYFLVGLDIPFSSASAFGFVRLGVKVALRE